ncbi:hypothetical protein, partial [Sphaerochaeta sp.]|uniref:hypothetical protein n=1 Tax=Sphaerochaeta sp. TaxID=1972642 RepID=UPI0025854396
MKSSEGWDLLSIGEISPDKIQKNLKEASVFLANDVRIIQSIVFSYHPFELLKYACWERRRIATVRKQDAFAQQVSQRLVSYLAALLPYWKASPSQNREIASKDWKRLTQVFEDLCRKTIRYIDNTALLLRSQQIIDSDELLLTYQEEATDFCLPQPVDAALLEQTYTALRYRLQPFNALVGEVFPAKLDGLLSSFLTLAKRAVEGIDQLREDSATFKQASMLQLEMLKSRGENVDDLDAVMDRIIKEQGWESWIESIVERRDGYALFNVLQDTKLSERDAYLLSRTFASQPTEEAPFLLTDDSLQNTRPFLRFGALYYCYDAESLLDKAYESIKRAVCEENPNLAQQWDGIEKEKHSLVPVTFFTAMLGTMNYTRNVEVPEGSLNALFDDGKKELIVQIPYTEHAYASINPFKDAQAYCAFLKTEQERREVALKQKKRTVFVDTKHPILYPLEMNQDVLNISFIQLANLASNWEGVAALKDLLGLSPFSDVHHDDSSPTKEPTDELELPVENELA